MKMSKENIAFIIAGVLAITAVLSILYGSLYDFFGVGYNWSDSSVSSETYNLEVKDLDNLEVKDLDNEEYRAKVLDLVNDYRADNNLPPMKLGHSRDTQKQAEETARTNDQSIKIGNYDNLLGFVTFYNEKDQVACKTISAPCTFNPRLEGYIFLKDFLNYEGKDSTYETWDPKDFLVSGDPILHIGLAVTDEYPITAFYQFQIEISYGTREYGDDFYKGEFKDGLEHGQGTYTWDNGGVYQGNWVNGKRTGQGKYTHPNGDVYEGQFKDGLEHGQGTYTWDNGEVYQGNWVNGERSY